MKTLHRFLVVLPLLLCVLPVKAQDTATTSGTTATTSAPPIDPAKAVEIRKLLELTGTAKLMEQMKGQLLNTFKQQRPDVPAELWTRLGTEMDTGALLEKLIPLYDKYYTLEDLKAVNAFYQSPVGQRMLAANPQIMRESMQIGQQWGREVGMKAEEEINKEKASAAGSGPAPAPSPTGN